MNTTPLYPRVVLDAVLTAMTEANVTPPELAEATGIKYMTLWRRLSGVTPFNVTELAAIATALGVSVEDLTTPKGVAS